MFSCRYSQPGCLPQHRIQHITSLVSLSNPHSSLLRPEQPQRSHSRQQVIAALTPPSVSSNLPRIIESIPRKGPAPNFPHFPELSLREPIRWVEDTTVNSQNGWVVIVLAAVALAVVAEIFILLKDKISGTTRQSRSERKEVQEAARRQQQLFDSQSTAQRQQQEEEQAQRLAQLPEAEQQRQVMEAGYQQELLRADRLEERNKGLLWLAVLTLAVLWVAGAFEIDATHPFLF